MPERPYGGEKLNDILDEIARWTVDVIYSAGYVGLAALIALQNLFPPIPSALILPLAGYLVSQGRFSFAPAVVAATTGSLGSALIFYALGHRFGEERLRRFVARFGRYLSIDEAGLDRASGWFERYGGAGVMFGRLVPGIGTFVSLPAGVARMGLLRFSVYTVLGAGTWNGAFIGLGWALGAQWRQAQRYADVSQYVVLAALALGILWLLWRLFKARKG